MVRANNIYACLVMFVFATCVKLNTMKRHLTLTAMACCLLLTLCAQEKPPAQKSITVTGTAEAEIIPDEIYVQVDLREYDKRGVGKIDIEVIKTNFLAACKSIGLADSAVSVQGYQGADNYWQYRRGKKKDPDLKASISYWVKINNTQKLDELVDKLDDEATQNFAIAKTAYSKQTELKKQMKIEAIKAAKEKAVYLSEAIDEHIGGALTITDVNEIIDADNNVPISQFYANNSNFRYNAASTNGDAAGSVGFKKLKFQFQVSVVFALK